MPASPVTCSVTEYPRLYVWMRPALWVDQVAFGKGTYPHGLTVTPGGNLWVALETGALAHVHS